MSETGAKIDPITADDHWALGTDRTIDITVTDASGARVDMTGWALEFKLTKPDASDAFTKTTVLGITLVSSLSDSTKDIARVVITAANTSGLAVGSDYWYRLKRTDTGYVEFIAAGSVELINLDP